MNFSLIRSGLAAAALVGVVGVAHAQDVTGAGASFPAPVYAKWADAYNKATGARLNYQSVGSGAGIRKLKAFMNLSYPLLLDSGSLIRQFGDPRTSGAGNPPSGHRRAPGTSGAGTAS